jgi:hypothetical protein
VREAKRAATLLFAQFLLGLLFLRFHARSFLTKRISSGKINKSTSKRRNGEKVAIIGKLPRSGAVRNGSDNQLPARELSCVDTEASGLERVFQDTSNLQDNSVTCRQNDVERSQTPQNKMGGNS